MPSPTIAPLAAASPTDCAGVPAARKTRFWGRLARKYAADPIGDMASDEATLRHVQGLLGSTRWKAPALANTIDRAIPP